jgi:hypothetical protein
MKTNPDDIKVGLKLQAWDAEDKKWYKVEVVRITEGVIILRDIDIKSDWEGMIWETNLVEMQDITLYKTL